MKAVGDRFWGKRGRYRVYLTPCTKCPVLDINVSLVVLLTCYDPGTAAQRCIPMSQKQLQEP